MHNDCVKSPLKTGKCTKKSDYCAKLRPIFDRFFFCGKNYQVKCMRKYGIYNIEVVKQYDYSSS
mgnify:CR=1 FL=1